MELRPIDLSRDTDQAVAGMRDFISRMDYHDFLPETDEELVGNLHRLLSLECIEILVAEHEGNLVGSICLLYSPGIWNTNRLHVEEVFLWVAREAPSTTLLRLLRWSMKRAKQKGATIITFKSLTSSPTSLDKVYRRLGLRPVETAYMGYC